MHIIPVIDLKDGLAVQAIGGNRDRYQPVHLTSSLCKSSQITDVVSRFLTLYPFQTIYIADLNAIAGDGNHGKTIAYLRRGYPDIEFWVDNGSIYDARNDGPDDFRMVFGTESQAQPSFVYRNGILSLDFKHNQALGHPGWVEMPEFWPDTIILMTLDLVGSNKGPDFEKLSALCQEHPDKRFIAAGGVRDINDLTQLKTIGIAGVLLASALHNGSLDTKTLQKF